MSEYRYVGNELDTFSLAINWKKYWSSFVNKIEGHSVLEVGAGIGENTALLHRSGLTTFVSIEPDEYLCSRLKHKIASTLGLEHVEVHCKRTSELSSNSKYSKIVYIDVLEHIEGDSEELIVASQLLENDGKLVILSPAHNFLFSPFDKRIGHFRRYNRSSIEKIVPHNLKIIDFKYLDCIGLFASLANKVLLRQSDPTRTQIYFWDRLMVPISMILDRLLGYRAGKTVLVIMQRA